MQKECDDRLELVDALLLAASYCDDSATAEVLRDDARRLASGGDALAECCRVNADFARRSGVATLLEEVKRA